MMNLRHLTDEERGTLRQMADSAGAVEMLRCVAGIIAHDHPDHTSGPRYRTALCKIAGQLAEEPWGDDRDGKPLMDVL